MHCTARPTATASIRFLVSRSSGPGAGPGPDLCEARTLVWVGIAGAMSGDGPAGLPGRPSDVPVGSESDDLSPRSATESAPGAPTPSKKY